MNNKWKGQLCSELIEEDITKELKANKSRIIRPDSMYTQDFLSDRVNIFVDEEFKIKDIKVG